jgi:hypothetical protein
MKPEPQSTGIFFMPHTNTSLSGKYLGLTVDDFQGCRKVDNWGGGADIHVLHIYFL